MLAIASGERSLNYLLWVIGNDGSWRPHDDQAAANGHFHIT
jgi:hypothetical protein